jgi:hypothetical protein
VKRDHNVYILGAGYSAEAGIPLMRQFLDHARREFESPRRRLPRYLEPHYESVLRFRHDSKRCRDTVDLDLDNIEILFSLVEMATLVGDRKPRLLESVKHFIGDTVTRSRRQQVVTRIGVESATFARLPHREALRNFIVEGDPQGSSGRLYLHMGLYSAALAIMSGLFDVEAKSAANTFITFNYDTILEDAIRDLGGWPTHGTSLTPYKGSVPPFDSPLTLPVLKLHGSANWAKVRVGSTRAHCYDSYRQFGSKYAPVVVPPTWRKGEMPPLFQEIWQTAHAALRNATRICIIGYSMPPTDVHFNYLIASALSGNVGLYGVTVIDYNPDRRTLGGPADSAVDDRYRALFGPLVGYQKYRFEDYGLISFLGSQHGDGALASIGRGSGVATFAIPDAAVA